VKIVELVGNSEHSFSDAVRNAVQIASQSIRHITGVEVLGSTADVGSDGRITSYKVNCKLAFLVDARRIDDAGQSEDPPTGAELTLGGARNEEDIARGGHDS